MIPANRFVPKPYFCNFSQISEFFFSTLVGGFEIHWCNFNPPTHQGGKKKLKNRQKYTKVRFWAKTVSGNQRKTPLVVRMSWSNRYLDDFLKNTFFKSVFSMFFGTFWTGFYLLSASFGRCRPPTTRNAQMGGRDPPRKCTKRVPTPLRH